jgi:protein OPY2
VGAIAGGVIGGVLVIGIVTYFVWRYCVKAKRAQYSQGEWEEDVIEARESEEKNISMRRDARASTHTVGSIASTVLTRASNIIQIAYIPGVTNRSGPSTPGVLVPPVPPIPIALSSTPTTADDSDHFFMPGALRDSTYSGISDRTSYARNSVASTIYGKNAVVSPVPAQTVIRGKAAVVSVKHNGGTSGDVTPPVPSVDFSRFGDQVPPSPAFSVGSTFLNSATTATQVKARSIKTIGSNSTLKAPKVVVTDEDAPKADTTRDSNAVTIIDDTPSLEQGPFSDPTPAYHTNNSTTSLSAIIEEAAKKSQAEESAKADEEEGTPFGDENAVKE